MIMSNNSRGRCDKCLKKNTPIVCTLSPNMIQGQICLKCFRGL